jgi:hypothetical protein
MAENANQTNTGTGTGTGAATTAPQRPAGTTQAPPAPLTTAALAGKPGGPANTLAPASAADIAASGAISEPGATAGIPVEHPAIDNNPRAGVPDVSNRIDLNDPGKPGQEAVMDSLRAQGKLTSAPAKAPEKA